MVKLAKEQHTFTFISIFYIHKWMQIHTFTHTHTCITIFYNFYIHGWLHSVFVLFSSFCLESDSTCQHPILVLFHFYVFICMFKKNKERYLKKKNVKINDKPLFSMSYKCVFMQLVAQSYFPLNSICSRMRVCLRNLNRNKKANLLVRIINWKSPQKIFIQAFIYMYIQTYCLFVYESDLNVFNKPNWP